MQLASKSLKWYVNRLSKGETFSFARFGNGEFLAIFGTADETPSGSQSFENPKIGLQLRKAIELQDQTYFRAIQSVGFLTKAALWSRIRKEFGNLSWYAADVFHHASAAGELFPLIEQLRKMSVGLIGPDHLRHSNFDSVFKYEWRIGVPEHNAYDDYYSIRTQILTRPPVDVYAFSAGPMAKILIAELHTVLSQRSFQIDFGSLWDVYCGVKSRGYHRKMSEEVLKCNLNQQ